MKHINTLISLFILVGLLSCKKSDPEPTPVTPTTPYEQYSTPFDAVPDTRNIVLYEVNLRAFSPSATLQGVIQKLDHIQSLGVNVIWLMPIHPIGQLNSVNSPYCVKDYKAVGTEYGTLNDLRQLTDQAHARGMAVIMDWVANHTSMDNAWVTDHKSWYSQDGSGNIIHPPGTNWLDVADLNYSNTEMRTAMIDAMEYWVFKANIDGFRCDYADGVPFDFWKTAWQTLNTFEGRKFIFFAEGARADHFTAGFHLSFGWQFYSALKDVFDGQAVSRIFTANTNEYSNVPDGKHWIRFTTNHDESAWDATPISLFNGINGALAASVVTVFTGVVPLIYGSQEIGRGNTLPFFSNTSLNWNDNPVMLNTYQKILQFYGGSDVAKNGQNTVYPHNDIACFKKTYNNQEIVVLANLRNSSISFTLPSGLENSSWTDVITQNTVVLQGQISLNPYQFYILKT